VLPPDTIPLYLQPDNDLSCNWYTLRVANTKCFRLMLYYPFICNSIVVRVAIDICSELQILSASAYAFSCNPTVVRVAIDVHSKLQILSASAWYYTPSAATRQCFELQTLSASAWYCTTPSVATRQWFELQSMCTPSCKYWVLKDFT
jgi:hypothetical protein